MNKKDLLLTWSPYFQTRESFKKKDTRSFLLLNMSVLNRYDARKSLNSHDATLPDIGDGKDIYIFYYVRFWAVC